jgi:NAD(P)-dependent dehydrogenase (short-subunit alcohol dehydrogenase family)
LNFRAIPLLYDRYSFPRSDERPGPIDSGDWKDDIGRGWRMTETVDPDGFSLSGKKALITGASRGIGAAIARSFASAGADVALLARSLGPLEGVADGVRKLNRTAVSISCDVTDPQQVAAACDEALEALGRIDILVNNAGGPVFQSHLNDVGIDGWQAVMSLNLFSVFYICRKLGPSLIAQGSGSVINVSSIGGLRSFPTIGPYCAAKAGVVSLTKTLAAEWGPYGVRVNALCPGFISTDVHNAYLSDERLSKLAIESVPLGRWGTADDVAGAAVWLASESSQYVTGAAIEIDGGLAFGIRKDYLTGMRQFR